MPKRVCVHVFEYRDGKTRVREVFQAESIKEAKAYYDLEYLKDVAQMLHKLKVDSGRLSFKTDCPLKLEFETVGIKACYMLAPRVEE